MFKRFVSLILTSVTMMCCMTSFTTVSAEEVSEEIVIEYVYNNQMTVFDAINIKRSIIAGEDTYRLSDYEYVRDNLIRKRCGELKYAKTAIISFDTMGIPMEDYSNPAVLDSKVVYVGDEIPIPQHTLKKEGCSHGGWQYNGVRYIDGEKFLVPDEGHIVFTPYWFNYRTITYYAGEYDDLLSFPYVTIQGTEGVGTELADSSRFARPGYKVSGWLCDYDGKSYGPLARYIVPDSDVVFTAIWEPLAITLSISAGNGNFNDKITETVYVDQEYVLPECTFTNGDKTFAGWLYDDVLYQPGDTITVPPLRAGKKLVLVASWV